MVVVVTMMVTMTTVVGVTTIMTMAMMSSEMIGRSRPRSTF
jgi:hypothetical protein